MLKSMIYKKGFWFLLASKITLSRALFVFVFIATIVSNSIFTNQLSSPFIPKLYLLFSIIYMFSWLINLSTYGRFNFHLYRHMLLYFLYPMTALLSFIVNYSTASPFSIFKLRVFLFPWLIGLIILQMFDYRHIRKIAITFVAFAIVNMLLISLSYLSESYYVLASGFFSDRNQVARFFSMVNVFLLISFFTTNSRKIKVLIIPFLFLILVSITFFFSRAGYLLYLVSTVFVLWQTKKKNIRRIMFITFPILFLVFAFMTSVRVKSDKMDVRNASDIGRIALLKAGINMIIDKPLFGVGYAMSNEKFEEYEDKGFPGLYDVRTIHNSYLVVFAEQGIFGFIAYLLLNFSIMYDLFRIIKKKEYFKDFSIELFCMCSLGLYLIHGLVNPTFDYIGTYWIVVVSGLIAINHNKSLLRNLKFQKESTGI